MARYRSYRKNQVKSLEKNAKRVYVIRMNKNNRKSVCAYKKKKKSDDWSNYG